MTIFLGSRVSGAESIAPDGGKEILSVVLEKEEIVPVCPVNVVEDAVQRTPVLLELEGDAPPWYGRTEGEEAAEKAYIQLVKLQNFMFTNRSDTVVFAQMQAVNAATVVAWEFAKVVHTANPAAAPFANLFDLSKITSSSPVLSQGRWYWCNTKIRFRIGVYSYPNLAAPAEDTYAENYNFVSAPNGLPILKNTGQGASMFYGTHTIVCYYPIGFVGNFCSAYQADQTSWLQQGLKHTIWTRYTTSG